MLQKSEIKTKTEELITGGFLVFNAVNDKIVRRCPQTVTFEERGEPS